MDLRARGSERWRRRGIDVLDAIENRFELRKNFESDRRARPGICRRKFAILFFILFVVSAGLGAFIAGKWGDLDTGPIPAGTPVGLLANVKPSEARKLANIKELVALLQQVKKASSEEERRDANAKLATKFLSISNSPDLVMDNGHYFGKDLTPQEPEDLIDLLKTF